MQTGCWGWEPDGGVGGMYAVAPWLKALTTKLKSEKSELTFCSFFLEIGAV